MKTEKLPKKAKEWEGREISPEEEEALKPLEDAEYAEIEKKLKDREYTAEIKPENHGQPSGILIRNRHGGIEYWIDNESAKQDMRAAALKKMLGKEAILNQWLEKYEGPEQ